MIYYTLNIDYTLNEEKNSVTYDAITFNAEYGALIETSNFSVLVKRDENIKLLESLVSDPNLIINKITVFKDDEVVYEDTIWNKLARIFVIGDSTGELSRNLQFVVSE